MPTYTYQAIDKKGKKSSGVIEGVKESEAKKKLKDQGYMPISITNMASKEISQSSKQQEINKKDLVYICRNISVLLESGIELEKAIQLVAKISKKKNIKSSLLKIHSDIVEGKNFSEAIRNMKNIFPKGFSVIVESGEATGKLHEALNNVADFTERQSKIAGKIKLSLLYPVILTLISVVIIAFMLTYILPEVLDAFKDTGQPLPGITKFFLSLSDFAIDYGIVMVVLSLICTIFLKQFSEKDSGKEKLERWILKTPFFSTFYIKSCTTKFSNILMSLVKNKVDLLESLRIAKDASESAILKKDIAITIEKLKEGENFNDAISNNRVLEDIFIEIMTVGEASGNLENVLSVASRNYEEELERNLNYLVGIFEPLVITIMGTIIMLIVFAILQPILTINQMII